jgi:hypothetical protein
MVGKGYSCYLNNNNLFQYRIPPEKFGSEMAQMAMLCWDRGLIRRRRFYRTIRSTGVFDGEYLECSGIADRSNDDTFCNMLILQVRIFFRNVRSLKYNSMKRVDVIVKRILRV